MKREKSFSLVEVLIASAIFSVVVLVILATVGSLSSVVSGLKTSKSVNNSIGFALNRISSDVAEADQQFVVGPDNLRGVALSNARPTEITSSGGTGGNVNCYYHEFNVNSGVNSTLNNFPVMFNDGGNTDIKEAVKLAGGDKAKIFFSNGSGARVPYEIKNIDPTDGSLVAFVLLSIVPNSSSNRFRINVCDGPVVDAQENKAAVWGNNYSGVWHLAEDGKDSTGQHDAVVKGAGDPSFKAPDDYTVTGKYAHFAAGGFLEISNPQTLPRQNKPRTICAWVRTNAPDWINGREPPEPNKMFYTLFSFAEGVNYDAAAVAVQGGIGGNTYLFSEDGTFYDTQGYTPFWYGKEYWGEFCMIDDGTNVKGRMYTMDGYLVYEGSFTRTSKDAPTNVARIGAYANGVDPWFGDITEVTVSDIIRSDDWLNAQTQNLGAWSYGGFVSDYGISNPTGNFLKPSLGGLPSCTTLGVKGFCDQYDLTTTSANGILLHTAGQYRFYYYDSGNKSIYMRTLDSDDPNRISDMFQTSYPATVHESKLTPDDLRVENFKIIGSTSKSGAPWVKITMDVSTKDFARRKTKVYTLSTTSTVRKTIW